MFNGPNGSGLISMEGHVDPHLVIPELQGMKVPIETFDDIDAFHALLAKVLRCKAAHETIYHLLLYWKNDAKRVDGRDGTESRTIGTPADLY